MKKNIKYKITGKTSFSIQIKETIYWTNYNVYSMHLIVHVYIPHIKARRYCLVFPLNEFIDNELRKMNDNKQLSNEFILLVTNAVKHILWA